MRRRQAGPRDRGRYREEEMTVVEEADDDKKRLLQIIDREGEEEEEEVRWQARLALMQCLQSVILGQILNFSELFSFICKIGLRILTA